MNGGLLILGLLQVSYSGAIIGDRGVTHGCLHKLQFYLTQALSLNNDKVCSRPLNNDNVCCRPIWQFCSCLCNNNKIDRKCSFVRKIWRFCSKSRYDCLILPPILIKLSTMMGFNGINLLCFDRLMSFFKILNSSGKHSYWASLNILNSACSIFFTVTLLEISIAYNFPFRISHSCLNFKRHAIGNTKFFQWRIMITFYKALIMTFSLDKIVNKFLFDF